MSGKKRPLHEGELQRANLQKSDDAAPDHPQPTTYIVSSFVRQKNAFYPTEGFFPHTGEPVEFHDYSKKSIALNARTTFALLDDNAELGVILESLEGLSKLADTDGTIRNPRAARTTREIRALLLKHGMQVVDDTTDDPHQGVTQHLSHEPKPLDLRSFHDLVTQELGISMGKAWLNGSNSHLNGRRPIDLITQGEFEEALEALEAMSTGAYA